MARVIWTIGPMIWGECIVPSFASIMTVTLLTLPKYWSYLCATWMNGWFCGSSSPKLVTSWVCAAKQRKNAVSAPTTPNTMKRRRRIHSPKRYQVIAFYGFPVRARLRSILAQAPALAAVLGVKDGAVADDPSVMRVEEPHLAQRERYRGHARIVRPCAIGLKAKRTARQSGGDSIVAGKQIDREQRIARRNLRRSRHQRVRRRARLVRLMGKPPALAAVVGLHHPSLQSARRAMLLIAERDAEQSRQDEIGEARIVAGSERTFPLRHQRLLLLSPALAAIFGRPDSPQLADHPAVIGVEETRTVKHRLLVRQRVVGQLRRKQPLQLALGETLAAVGRAHHQRAVADKVAMQRVGKRQAENEQVRSRVQTLPALAAVARAHHQPVLPAQVAVAIVGHLDSEDAQLGADVDPLEMTPAVLGQQHLAPIADDKRARRAGRPYIEKFVGQRDIAKRQRRQHNFAMTRAGRERD